MIKFKVDIKVKIEYDRQAKMFVAYVPALGVASQGKTRPEAEEAIKEAVECWLEVSHKCDKLAWDSYWKGNKK